MLTEVRETIPPSGAEAGSIYSLFNTTVLGPNAEVTSSSVGFYAHTEAH